MLVLVLPSGPFSLPAGFDAVGSTPGTTPRADAVVLRAGAGFSAHATAYLCALAGADVLALQDSGPLPEELSGAERVSEDSSTGAGEALSAALGRCRTRRRAATASAPAATEGDALRQALERSDSLKANLEAEQQRR